MISTSTEPAGIRPSPGPTGPVPQPLSFVFTDVEGSTRLLEQLGARYADVLAGHADIVAGLAAETHGRLVDTQGDSFFLVFPTTAGAASFAAGLQRAIARQPWPDGATVRIRVGIHRGVAAAGRTGLIGLDVHHAARVGAAAHGGQVLLSPAAATDLERDPVAGLSPRSLGTFHLKDIRGPIELFQLDGAGLAEGFPPPRTLDERDEPPTPGDAPHPGLVAFEETDAARFFGREEIVAAVVARLRQHGFLALVGASGSGKSSILRAGVLPAWRSLEADHGRAPSIAFLTPTGQPTAALEHALAAAGGRPSLVAVDQLEELFIECPDESERSRFIGRLTDLLDTGVRVAVAIRADRYDRLAPYDRLRTLVSEHQAYVGPMRRDELRAAIEGPVHLGGWRMAPGLTELILHDVGDEPGALPLLSHAMHETWLRRRGSTLTLRGYLESGGVQGAIARTADQTVDALDAAGRTLARDIFLRLTDLGDESPDTRRRASLAELVDGRRDPAAARVVLDRLVAARLVVTDGPSAEMAHEALVREWPALRDWIEEDRESLRFHRSLITAARDWDANGRDDALLLRGVRLAQATAWVESGADSAGAIERAFVERSREAARAEEAARAAQQARELEAAQRLAEAEGRRAAESASAASRLRRRAIVLAAAFGLAAVLAVAAAAAGLVASENAEQARRNAVAADAAAQEATREAARADSRRLAAEAGAVMGRQDSGELPVQLALAGLRRAYTPEADLAVQRAAQRHLPTLVLPFASPAAPGAPTPVLPVDRLAATPDGRWLLVALADGTAQRVDLAGGRVVERYNEPRDGQAFQAVAMSRDGSLAAIQQGAARFRILWTADWSELAPVGEAADAVHVSEAAFLPDSSALVTCDEAGTARLHELATGATRVVAERPSDAGTYDCALSPDGTRLALTYGDLVDVLRVEDGVTEQTLRGSPHEVVGVDWLPDGRTLVSVAIGPDMRWWDTTTGETIRRIVPHVGGVNTVTVSRDGRTIITAGSDGAAGVWDAATGDPLTTLWDHGIITAVGVLEDGRFAMGSSRGDLLVWDREPAVPSSASAGGPATGLAQSADGSRLAAGTEDGLVTVWAIDEDGGLEQQARFEGPPAADLRFAPDGRTLLVAGTGRPAEIRDLGDGSLVRALGGPGLGWGGLDPTGELALVPDADGHPILVSTADGSERRRFGDDVATEAELSADGATVVTVHQEQDGAENWLDRWDARTGELLGSWPLPPRYPVLDLALSADGSRAAVGGINLAADRGAVTVIDLATGAPVVEFARHPEVVSSVTFTPDGTALVSGGDDRTARLWDPETGEQARVMPSVDDQAVRAVLPLAGTTIAIGDAGGMVHLVPASMDATVDAICGRIFRGLETSDRATYDVTVDALCPAG